MRKPEMPSRPRDVAQGAVDYLFGVTQMPVVLTDRSFNLLASSVHHTSDANRRSAILERRTPAPSRRFVAHLGEDLRRACTVIPAQPAIGMDMERWCVPLLDGDSALYFWLLREKDGRCRMDDAVAAALDMEGALRRLGRAGASDTELIRQCVHDLFDEDPTVRGFARRRLEAAGRSPAVDADVAIVGQAAAGQAAALSSTQLLETVEDAGLPADTLVGRHDGMVVLISDPGRRPWVVQALRDVVRDSSDARLTVGMTCMRESENPVAAARRAGFMARVAMLPECDELMQWENAGPWAALSGVPLTWDSVDRFSPGCKELVLDKPHLAQTALAHLESSGVDATADQLSIHRTTLYYRLKQVDRYLGAGWDEGWRRAGTHSSLQLARLLRVMRTG